MGIKGKASGESSVTDRELEVPVEFELLDDTIDVRDPRIFCLPLASFDVKSVEVLQRQMQDEAKEISIKDVSAK